MNHASRTQTAALVALLACGTPACTAPAPAGDPRLKPEYGKDGRLTRLTYDKNADGKDDTFAFMDGPIVVRVEVDEDGDGKIDRWEYHRAGAIAGDPTAPANANAPDKTIERIERATQHDGRISRKEFFENGTLIRIEEDTDADGQIDKWETYAAGTLASMAFDSQHRGTPDRRLVYNADGSLNRIEADPAGTGSFQRVEP
jgi:hypothetical protein